MQNLIYKLDQLSIEQYDRIEQLILAENHTGIIKYLYPNIEATDIELAFDSLSIALHDVHNISLGANYLHFGINHLFDLSIGTYELYQNNQSNGLELSTAILYEKFDSIAEINHNKKNITCLVNAKLAIEIRKYILECEIELQKTFTPAFVNSSYTNKEVQAGIKSLEMYGIYNTYFNICSQFGISLAQVKEMKVYDFYLYICQNKALNQYHTNLQNLKKEQ